MSKSRNAKKMDVTPSQSNPEPVSEQVAETGNTTGHQVENETKSRRTKRPRKVFSPDDIEEEARSRRKQKKPKRFPFSSSAPNRPHDILPNGEPFSCELCKSRYVVNTNMKKTLKNKRSKNTPVPKQVFDQNSGKYLVLCNACAQAMTKQYRPKADKPGPSDEEKEKHIQEAAKWAKNIAEKFDLPNAVHLYCPVFKRTMCGCLQNYIEESGGEVEKQKRVSQLSAMAAEARRLSALKCYDLNDASRSLEKINQDSAEETQDSSNNSEDQSPSKKKVKQSKGAVIGLGNGHKKSEKFAMFVLGKREYLKKQLKLCERAVQKILFYSNNFLHKRLVTEEKRCRVRPVKGKARLGLLQSFNDIAKKRCCVDNCVMMALTHRSLLEEWRRRSQEGQAEARKVIAEMLTPSANARKNCYTFVTAVTGCSRTTVVQVNQQMVQSGGWIEPPIHGLKMLHAKKKVKEKDTFLKDHQQKKTKRKATKSSSSQSSTTDMDPSETVVINDGNSSCTIVITDEDNSTVNSQKSKLQILQEQLSQQQEQLHQQQQLQQQLLQQTLSSNSQTDNISLLQQVNNQLNIQIQNTQRGLQQTLHSMGLLVSSDTSSNQDKTAGSSSIGGTKNIPQAKTFPIKTYFQPESTISGTTFPVSSVNVSSSINVSQGNQMMVNSSNYPWEIIQQVPVVQNSSQIIQLPQQVFTSQQQTVQPTQQVFQIPAGQVVGSQPLVRPQIVQTPQQIVVMQQPNYGINSTRSNSNIIQLQQGVSTTTPKVVAVGKEGENVVYTVTIPNSQPEQQIVQLPFVGENRTVVLPESQNQNVQVSNLPSGQHGNRMAEALSRMEVVEMCLTQVEPKRKNADNQMMLQKVPFVTSTTTETQSIVSDPAAIENFNLEPVTLSKIVQGNIKQKNKQKSTTKSQTKRQTTKNKQNAMTVKSVHPSNMAVTNDRASFNNKSSIISLPKSNSLENIQFTAVDINKPQTELSSVPVSTQHRIGERNDTLTNGPKDKQSNSLDQSSLQVDSTLTAEHMRFSLPLSEVITMYSSQGDKISSEDNSQHLQLSLQINKVPGSSGDAVHVNTVDLGSIVIMDNEQNTPQNIPKTVLDQFESFTKGQRSRRESFSTEQQLVIDEDTMSLSGDGHVTDTDEEVQDILQSGDGLKKRPRSSKNQASLLMKKSDTRPFLPNVERSDTVIIDDSRLHVSTEQMQISHDMERSDTIRLPEEKEPSMTISLPIKKQKVRNKGKDKKQTQQTVTTDSGNHSGNMEGTSQNMGNQIILGGNMPSVDKAWLHKLMNSNNLKLS